MKDNKIYLQRILSCIQDIEKYLKEINFQDFSINNLVQDAVLMKIVVLGEEINKISDTLKEKYEDIPWREAVAVRNIVAHGYYKIDLDIIWKIYKEDLPMLKVKIQEILKNLN